MGSCRPGSQLTMIRRVPRTMIGEGSWPQTDIASFACKLYKLIRVSLYLLPIWAAKKNQVAALRAEQLRVCLRTSTRVPRRQACPEPNKRDTKAVSTASCCPTPLT